MKTQTLKPYPEYAASGLPWLAEVPEHWATERAKWLFQRMGRPVRSDDDVVTCFRDGIVTLRKKRRVRGFTESLKEIGYQGVREGDLVIHAMDAFAGAVGVSDSDGKCTPVYAVCQPKQDVDPRYYAHIVREMARTQWIAALAKGIRERSTDFRFDDFAGQVVPVPTKDEQQGIVAFLAHADRRINRIIRARRRLISLLNEQKQAIIQRAVTRGVGPNVHLRPSGVDSLGDIPEQWEVRRLKLVAQLHRGYDLPDYRRIEGDYPVISSGGVIGTHAEFMIAGPGVVTGRYGSTGRVYYIESDYWPHNTALYVSEFHGNVPRYVYYLLQTLTFGAHSAKSAVPGIDRKDLYPIAVPVPPIPEQQTIVEFLDVETSGVEATIVEVQRTIDFIREYRNRLISDVVTGRLDVRDVELPALDEDEMIGEWDEGTEEEPDETTETEEIALADV